MQNFKQLLEERTPELLELARQNREREEREIVEEAAWVRCNEKVRALSTQVEETALFYKQNKSRRVKEFAADVRRTYDIELDPVEGYEVTLILYYCDNLLKKARYIAWNDKDNVCFLRELDDLVL